MKILLAIAAGVYLEISCRETWGKSVPEVMKTAWEIGTGAIEMRRDRTPYSMNDPFRK